MKVTFDNSRILEHGKQFIIAIYTDDFGNYIHSRKFGVVDTALMYRDALIGSEITNTNIRVAKDDTYYRIECKITRGDHIEEFHSRKMNLIDVQEERTRLIDND